MKEMTKDDKKWKLEYILEEHTSYLFFEQTYFHFIPEIASLLYRHHHCGIQELRNYFSNCLLKPI